MASLELDLKYRPRRFRDVVGNAGVVRLLLARSRAGSLAGRSMMFGGPKGCGKTSLARIVALAIVCDRLQDGEPCGSCDSCAAVLADGSMVADEFDAATGGTVDRIRGILADLEYGTVNGRPRVVILDEAQRLSKASQDALLKSVEDRRLVAILCTTEPHKIGEAIRSRVEEYPVSPPSLEDLTGRVLEICRKEGIQAHEEAVRLMCQHLKCCPRECVSAAETLSAVGGVNEQSVREFLRFDSYEAVAEVLTAVDADPAAALSRLDSVMQREGAAWVRDAMVHAISSSMRAAVGARPTYPVATSFFAARGMRWADLARSLGQIEKPQAPDVEAAILAECPRMPSPAPFVVQAPPPPAVQPGPVVRPQQVSAPPSAQAPAPAPRTPDPPKPSVKPPEPPQPKTMTIDGVIFSTAERLTSIDHKIEPGSRGAPAPEAGPTARVEWDGAHAPIPEKDFARGLKQRLQKN